MAVPLPPYPKTTYLQTGNLQNLVSWDAVVGATSYVLQRSTDGITFADLTTVVALQYVDTAVTAGTQYWYKVRSKNADGESVNVTPTPSSVVPTVSGEKSLLELRLMTLQRADRLRSNFVTKPEINSFINLACDELYDLVTSAYEDYNVYPSAVYFTTNGTAQSYPLPNGVTTFTLADGSSVVAPPIYKLAGIDLGLNTSANSFVTVNKYNFIDRNRFFFPNTSSTIYGVFGLRYRLVGNTIRFIPQPSAGQPIGIWYVPRRTQLLLDTDKVDGFNGWTNYVIARAAKYVLDKEESDTSKLDEEITFLKDRIEAMTPNRDEGQADTISDVRGTNEWDPYGSGGPWGLSGGY